MGVSETDWLFSSLTKRYTPEQVAARIQAALPPPQLAGLDKRLNKVIRGSIRDRFGWSTMPTTFKAPQPMDRQISKARDLAQAFLDERLPQAADPEELEAFIAAFNRLIQRPDGAASFAMDRMDRKQRAATGLTLSRRRYDRLFRMAGRLERKLAILRRELRKHELLLVGKAGLVRDIAAEDLAGRPLTAAFVAYYSARMKLRSEFTILGQQKPFDELSAALLQACEHDPDTHWLSIARVFPRADVLKRLTAAEQGALLGRWFEILHQTATVLETAAARSDMDLESMVVRRGDDSTTWNTFAGAWNRARDHWIALLDALGMAAVLEVMTPGKVMKLIAADVAHWHRISGGGLHPDTAIWRALPKPWLVLTGRARCGLAEVETACRAAGVDPVKSGWSAARARNRVAKFRYTPELVHGVTVENPYLGDLLKRMGAFSGRPLKQDVLDQIHAG